MDSSSQRPRRPLSVGSHVFEQIEGSGDPAQAAATAHEVAWIVAFGTDRAGGEARAAQAAIADLVARDGLGDIAQLWAPCAADSLPGALWRLYAVATWVRANPQLASREFDAGRHRAGSATAIAGVADPPTPQACVQMIDEVMTGAGAGELAMTLYRVAALCRIVAAGRADGGEQDASAAALLDTANALVRAGRRVDEGTSY